MASVALAHGINANMLRCWVRAHATTGTPSSAPSTIAHGGRDAQALSFVRLPIEVDKPLEAPPPPPTSALIEVQIQRGETRLVVRLPMIGDSAAWVREVLG